MQYLPRTETSLNAELKAFLAEIDDLAWKRLGTALDLTTSINGDSEQLSFLGHRSVHLPLV